MAKPSSSLFKRLAKRASIATGRPLTFMIAVGLILAWAVTGPIFHYGDTWQLVINTTTTIITFLMVFLIQNTQNRDTAAVQIKLDELIRSVEGAHNGLLDLEELDDEVLDRVKARYCTLAEAAREELEKGGLDTGRPKVDPEEGSDDGSDEGAEKPTNTRSTKPKRRESDA
jgi:low affinity Fe/Cu permease